MNIIILGPQGCGKGTQARKLVDKYGFYYVGMGEFFRELSKENEEIKEILVRGELVPDDLAFKLLTEKLVKEGHFDNILFDGYPRSRVQFHAIKDWLEDHGAGLHLAVLINISEEETVRRLSARRTDKNTGEIYNLITKKPPQSVQEADLVQREDDKPKAIRERLSEYHQVTEPVLSDMRGLGILREIDGQRPIDEIFADIVQIIENEKN